MTEIIVNLNDVDKRLDNFLLKYFPYLTKPMIYKYIRTNKIKVNKKKQDFNYKLRMHDKITVFFNEEKREVNNQLWFLKFDKKIDVVYEDENIVIMNKPIGVISQSNGFSEDSMQARFLKYVYDSKQYNPENENIFVPSICHRLDRNTSGLMIGAKNSMALIEMNRILKEHEIIKKYQCLVFGTLPKKKERLIAFHYKNENDSLVYINKDQKPHYKEIITEYEVLWTDRKYSLLKINLITGRTHQIRAHLNFIGHPIVGEKKYKNSNSDFDSRFKHQALVCNEIAFKINDSSELKYLNTKIIKINNLWFKSILNIT
ncbi:MAG: RluA family pseudouridine synthase [Mycoplasma sp.]